MRTAEAIIECLKNENVTTIFGYPGATVVPLYEALRKSDLRHILVRHEQAAGHIASGFARISRGIGVCITTSGPGATNIITSIATAYMDSIPLIIITGQVSSNLIGRDVFQEADITGATESFTKHNYLVKEGKDIPRIIKEAFYIARTGRPGPVLIDIPIDVQREEIKFSYPSAIDIRGYKPNINGHKWQIKKAIKKIEESKKPLICVGGGIVAANARLELKRFVEKSKIPVVHTLMGKDDMDVGEPYYVGLIGSHGFSYANKAISNSDLIILVGTRIADRSTAKDTHVDKNARIIHIDIDPAEIGKNLKIDIPVVGDCKNILSKMADKIQPGDYIKWVEEIKKWKDSEEKIYEYNNSVNPKKIIKLISDEMRDTAIITTDVGQNQIWCARNFKIFGKRRFITSGGLGTMGYSLPSAIGAKMANPDEDVIAVMGDGGFQMSLFELATIKENNLNIKIIVFNNSGLGMVREIQKFEYEGEFGVEFKCNPDFVKIAEAYNIRGKKVYSNKEFIETFKEIQKSDSAFLIECIVDSNESTL